MKNSLGMEGKERREEESKGKGKRKNNVKKGDEENTGKGKCTDRWRKIGGRKGRDWIEGLR